MCLNLIEMGSKKVKKKIHLSGLSLLFSSFPPWCRPVPAQAFYLVILAGVKPSFPLPLYNHIRTGLTTYSTKMESIPSAIHIWPWSRYYDFRGYGYFQRCIASHGAHIWLLSTSPMAKMDWPTHLLNILHLERYYLVQRDFQAELGLDFGWAMVSWFASGMMFGRATLLRDACHNLYQFTRFSWPQSDRLHSIWRGKKDFSPYSTAHPSWLPNTFFSMDCINLIFQPEENIFCNPHGKNYANSA